MPGWVRCIRLLCMAAPLAVLACSESRSAADRPSGGAPLVTSEGPGLAASEREQILAFLVAHDVSPADVSFAGRLVTLQGDAYLYADDLLRAARSAPIAKGRVPTLASPEESGFPDCSVEVCGAVAPLSYAALGATSAELLFRRPDTTRTYYLVLDDAAPDYFTTTPGDAGSGSGVLGAAVAAIVDASPTDCLEPNLFEVVRASEYQALSTATREASYRVDVSTGQFFEVCSGSGVACANLPRLGSTNLASAATERLRLGDHIAFVDKALVQPTTALAEFSAYAIGVATHELFHTLGFAHTTPGLLGETVVPGSAEGSSHLSIMHAASSNRNYRDTPQADDLLMLSLLYGSDCDYSDGFRTITRSAPSDAGAAPDAGTPPAPASIF